jgi:hypothetical protein
MKIIDASVDSKGRLLLTVKLLDRMYQTLRCEEIELDTNSTVEYFDNCDSLPLRIKIKGSERTTGVMRFTMKKITLWNKRPPKKKPNKISRKRG